MICSEHFFEIKNADDPSFVPSLFPEEMAESVSDQQVHEKASRDWSVLEKVFDRLPAVDPGRVGRTNGRGNTSQLQEAFRELARHVCQLLVAHDSELLIEGTVGVTVDGGAHVMLLHFSDQVHKTEASDPEENVQNPASEPTAEGDVLHDIAKNDAKGIKQVQTSIILSEDKSPAVENVEYNVNSSTYTASSLQYSSGSSKILSSLAQHMASTVHPNSGAPYDAVVSQTHKRPADTDSNVNDKPKQQTLLRELLCAPLPPKRPCRPVSSAYNASTAPVNSAYNAGAGGGEVVRPRRPAANSTVLGGLLQTGNYPQHDLNFCAVTEASSDARPRRDLGSAMQGGGYGSQQLGTGVDVHSPQFGGNAVRALLRLASAHAATGRHDMLRNSENRESAASENEGFVNDASADASLDRRFSILYQNLVDPDVGCTSSEPAGSSQNSERNDLSMTVGSMPEQKSPVTVKEEAVDPSYE